MGQNSESNHQYSHLKSTSASSLLPEQNAFKPFMAYLNSTLFTLANSLISLTIGILSQCQDWKK